jgi:hypothetical protein
LTTVPFPPIPPGLTTVPFPLGTASRICSLPVDQLRALNGNGAPLPCQTRSIVNSDVQSRRACGLARTPPICSRGRSAHSHGLTITLPEERPGGARNPAQGKNSARFQSRAAYISFAARRSNRGVAKSHEYND